jgi:hypothetical protein
VAAAYDHHEARQGHMAAVRAIRNLRSQDSTLSPTKAKRGQESPGLKEHPMALDASGNFQTSSSPMPSGATGVTGSSGNVAAGSAVATLAAVAGKTTYIAGFSVTAAGATAASVVTATVAGVITGTLSYTVSVPAGVTTGITPLIVKYVPPIQASAVNTAIVVTLPSLGAGNTNATVVAHGFQI